MRILATLAGLFLLGGPLPAVADSPQAVTVRVLAPDGGPAAGADVWVYQYGRAETGLSEPLQPSLLVAQADAKGEVTVRLPVTTDHGGTNVHARDAAGRIGGGSLRNWGAARATAATVTVRLVETADRPGRVTDAAGKPISGATVRLRAMSPPPDEQGRRAGESIGVPGELRPRYTATTGTDGRFVLTGIPVAHVLFFKVSAPGGGETWYDAPADGELVVTHAAPGAVRLTVSGVESATLKGVRWTLGSTAGRPGRPPATGAAQPRRMAGGVFDGKPDLVVPDVVPGRYQLTLHQTLTAPATPQNVEPFEVKPGETAVVPLRFGPAAAVTGRVVAEGGRTGVAGAVLSVQLRTGNEDRPRYLGTVTTAADGTFTAHGPAGWYQVWLQAAPDGYAQPILGPGREGLFEPARVELGKTHRFPDAALPEAAAFVGRVVLPGDKPAAGAEIDDANAHIGGSRNTKLRADADGRFTAGGLLPGDAVSYRVRLGKAVNVPVTHILGKTAGPTTIELSEANAIALKGVVTDARGVPVPGAKVVLWHNISGVGRHSSRGISMPRTTVTTDKNGRYEFAGLWTKDLYDVKASADGFGETEAKNLIGEAGQVREVPPLVLTRAALAVAGVVIGTDGKPVSGATVFGVDGPAPVSARTGPDGRFSLTGFYDAPGFVFARKEGHRLTAVPITPGAKEPVTVTLRLLTDPPPPAPVVPPDHAAAEARLLRHLLTKMWDSRGELGYGGSAVQYMARIDPAQARKWAAEEEKRTDGKTKWGRLVDEAERAKTLLATAQEDVDEAISIMRKVTGYTGFYEVLRLGRRLLDVDKAKAGRVAEEAAVRARQLTLPEKVYTLAQAGELAGRAGNRAGGEKLVREAVALAEKLPAAGRDRDTMARGMAAARLAPFDWPAAKALLDELKDPSEHNRFLTQAAVQLARADWPRAKAALELFRPDNASYRHDARVYVGTAVVRERPDEAVALVDAIPEAAARARGYVMLAERLAATDRGRAVRLIDAALDLVDRDAEAFRGWTSYGGRAGYAVMAANVAKQVGHPDLSGVVARVLAARPAGQDNWSSSVNERANQLVNVAAALALVDPASARQVLAGVAPPDRYIDMAMSQQRDWLFALALADPDRAITLIDKRFEQAKTMRGGSRNYALSGMSELASVLTAEDRYEDLTHWASLVRPLRDPD